MKREIQAERIVCVAACTRDHGMSGKLCTHIYALIMYHSDNILILFDVNWSQVQSMPVISVTREGG